MTKPDDEIISEASERGGLHSTQAPIKIVVPLGGERLHHPLQMTLGCVSTWNTERTFIPSHIDLQRSGLCLWTLARASSTSAHSESNLAIKTTLTVRRAL